MKNQPSKSNEKYRLSATNETLALNSNRYDTLQQKMKNKRRYQTGSLQLKENMFVPPTNQLLSNYIALSKNGMSDRVSDHMDISTNKTSEKKNSNLDFNCTMRVPVSTKHHSHASGQNFFPNNTGSILLSQKGTNASGISLDKSQGATARRKAGNSGSKKQFVPVLDMKKVNLKQISNIIRSNAVSIRDGKDGKNKEEVMESTLYKNLTQKIIKDQHNQGTNRSSRKDSTTTKINQFKKNATQLVKPRESSAAQSTTNKNKISFVFDDALKSNRSGYGANRAGKKSLNLTGTLPKNLLSPNNGDRKHKHSEYFQETARFSNSQAYQSNQNKLSGKPSGSSNIGSTVININIENGGCKHSKIDQLNQTTKIVRNESISSANSHGNESDGAYKLTNNNKAQGSNHKKQNSQLPNAAALLLNEILQRQQFNHQKIHSVKATPRSQDRTTAAQILKHANKGKRTRQVSLIGNQLQAPSTQEVDISDVQVGVTIEPSVEEQVKGKTQNVQSLIQEINSQLKNQESRGHQVITNIPSSLSPRVQQNSQSFRSQASSFVSVIPSQPVKLVQEDLSFPMTAGKALKHFGNDLTDYEKGEILDYKQVYYLGKSAAKIKGTPIHQYNYGYDDERGDYKVVLKDHIGFRYETIEFIGKGSFGQALKCLDHKTGELVAIKVIRNKKRYQHQAGVELHILQHLQEYDPDDQFNIIQIKDHAIFRKHLVISFELFSINLYEFIKNNNFQGVSLGLIRRFAIQILQSLKYLQEQSIIHCDLKPENILLKQADKSGIKVIDFGSSCFNDKRIYTYIQSRFYRAPEIVLGIPYTAAIDMWSFGCILVELYTGFPIFPGESEMEQLHMIMEVRGIPSANVLASSTRRKLFFDENNQPLLSENNRGKMRYPSIKDLRNVIGCSSDTFLDFIDKCLDWDPHQRLTPMEGLQHEWITEGLPPKVLQHHLKMLKVSTTPNQVEKLDSKSQPKQEKRGHSYDMAASKPKKQSDTFNQTIQMAQFYAEKKSMLNKSGNVLLPEETKYHKNKDSFENEKSKTTNVANILNEIKTSKGSGGVQANYFSQISSDEDEEGEESGAVEYDERGNMKKDQKRKHIPFSFLMHHYMKTNPSDDQPEFYNPGDQTKVNNFMAGEQKPKYGQKSLNKSNNL